MKIMGKSCIMFLFEPGSICNGLTVEYLPIYLGLSVPYIRLLGCCFLSTVHSLTFEDNGEIMHTVFI